MVDLGRAMSSQPGPNNRQPSSHRRRLELANAGFGLLLVDVIILGVLALLIDKVGVGLVPAMVIGGIPGLCLALWRPGNPSRLGYRFARMPRDLSRVERELQATMVRLRKRWVMVLASLPYFIGLAFYWLNSDGPPALAPVDDALFAGFLSALHALSLAWAVQYLQVLWEARGE